MDRVGALKWEADVEIRVLKYFLTVAREGGINRAAQVLHITQPTLSRQLAELEREVGVTLLKRGARKSILTNEGILLRRRAEEILALVDKTEQELTEQEEQIEGRIVIGGGELASMEILPRLIVPFHKKYPRVTYDIYTANADLVAEQMEKGLVDIGILLEPINIEKFSFIRLQQKESWTVVMRPDDPLAKKKSIRVQDLLGSDLILPRRLNVQNEVLSWFGNDIKKVNILLTSNFSTNAAVMVRGGLGRGIVIEGSASFWDKKQVVTRPIAPAPTDTSVIAWKREQPFSQAATKFIEHIKCFLSIS